MAITYRILLVERHIDMARIVFQVEYMGKAKQFDTTVPVTDSNLSDASLCTSAWQLVKSDAEVFISKVTDGTYLNGATFVPQPDGSLMF